MPTENNTGLTWTFKSGYHYFLRDDEAQGLCNHERYSLFRDHPDYKRISIWSGPLDKVLPCFHRCVWKDRFNRGRRHIDPTTVFLDERGQA